MEQQRENSLLDLQLDPTSQSYLSEASRWGKFLAIVGFIFCGLLALSAFFVGAIFSSFSSQLGTNFGGGIITVVYLLMAVLYFFPCYYLYNFSVKMQTALRVNDQQSLQASFSNLKSFYKFWGILTIVMLAFYLIALVIAIIAAASLRSGI
ncbi:MAG TPA: DUF5362 family protein [Chitinophagaceae bacterium]|nr:DUF5362 family protein [Chitinophagaceae bacterium]